LKTSSRRGDITTPRAILRGAARLDAGLTLESVARALPGKRWALLSKAQRKNRVSYIARIERAGTPCEKMARRLAALYDCSHFLFLLEAPASPQGQNKQRHRTRLVRASRPAASHAAGQTSFSS
jgi:transcriptional regulator with XRE-family HTH domain